MGKLIRLEIQGEFNLGFSINAKIEEDSPLLSPSDNRLIAGITGKLADNLQLLEKYRNWQAIYRNITTSFPTFPLQRRPSLTNVSANIQENDFEPFKKQTNDLITSFNAWLKDKAFLPIESLFRNHLNPNDENRILLLTDNHWLRKLPWQEWDLLREFTQTEIGFASPNFKQVQQLSPTSKNGVKILAILGYQADVESQGEAIQNLGKNVNCPPNPPNMGGTGFFSPQVWGVGGQNYNFSVTPIEVTWLKQPKREELDEPLWKQRWDIIFFVGHGESQDEWKTGTIWINEDDKITISELTNHLKKAIENGLKLAILNCCDGLGLAHSLAEGEDLYLPQMIVMREELPVAVAPHFLQYFLEEFTQYNSLYASVREARRRLRILEKDFPCASNLPVICQNPAVKPLRWNDLVIPACPYRGLSAFQEEDAELFFGRETFTNHLLKVVEDKKLVAVIGASGSGKSSVVLAGLIPRLRQKENWLIASLRPGATPFENLAKALLLPEQLATELQEGIRSLPDVLKTIGESRTVLLVVDQFEEIYSYPNQKFLDCLLEAVRDVSAFRLVITLRADFLGQAIEYNPLREQLQRWKPEFIGAMERQQLQAVIEEPAKKRGVYLEAGLTEHILNDVGNEPGYLPLLEFALTEMWDKQENGWLTRQVYDDIGGVKNALRRHAERVYDELEKADRERVKRIFLQLVSPGEGTEYIRRLATRTEIGEANWDLVIRLATARLVVSSRNETTEIETVEIGHEALIKAWPDLNKWIEENDVFLRWKKRLQEALKEWERNDNKESYLLQGAPLGEAEGYLQQRLGDISPAERVFIQLGLGLRDRQRRRTILSLTSGLVAVSILASVATWQSLNNQINVGAFSSESLLSSRKEFDSLIEAIKAAKLSRQWSLIVHPDNRFRAITALQQAVYGVKERNRLEGHKYFVHDVNFSPDGQMIATASAEGTAKIWSSNGTLLQTLGNGIGGIGIRRELNKENNKIVIVSTTKDKPAFKAGILVKDILTKINGKSVQLRENNNLLLGAVGSEVTLTIMRGEKELEFKLIREPVDSDLIFKVFSISFSPDSETIALGGGNGTVNLWSREGAFIKTLNGHTDGVRRVSFSPDGQTIASASDDKTVKLWNRDGTLIKTLEHKDKVWVVSFSPDNQTIASATWDGNVHLWSRDGTWIKTIMVYPGSAPSTNINDVTFSPDSQTIAIATPSGVELWSRDGQKLQNLPRPTRSFNLFPCYRVRFSPDGKIIAGGMTEGKVILWNRDGQKIVEFVGDSTAINSVSFSPDSKTLASVGYDRIVKLWPLDFPNPQTLESENWVTIFNRVSFSPDGKIIATANRSDVKFWLRDGTLVKSLTELFKDSRYVSLVRFSPDGKTIASIDSDDNVKLWNINGGEPKTLEIEQSEYSTGDSFEDISFSPNGEMIAGASDDTITIWNLANGQSKIWKGNHSITAVSFSPDSKLIATAGNYLWTVNIWKPDSSLVKSLIGHSNTVHSVSFSPDSKMIASASVDQTIKLWSSEGNLLKTFIGHNNAVWSVTFSPNNKMLASASADGTIKLWNLEGRELKTLQGYGTEGEAKGLSFSPDGKILASIGQYTRGNISTDLSVILWNLDIDDLLARGCDWVGDYLKSNPNVSPSDRHLCDGIEPSSQLLLDKGKNLARAGHVEDAVTKFREALKRDSSWNFDPQTKAQQLAAASVLLAEGENLARASDVDSAITKFKQALEQDLSLDFEPEKKAQLLAVPLLIKEGDNLAKLGDLEAAIAKYQKALRWDYRLKFDPKERAQKIAALAKNTK